MHIALIRQSYNPFGGAERFVERALAALSGSEVQLTLIARTWRGAAAGAHTWRKCNPFYLGRLWRDASFACAAQRAMREGGFDLVQSHERIPGCDIFRAGDGVHATWLDLRAGGLSALARLGQAISPWHRYTLAMEARMLRHPKLRAVICNSHMVADDIARRFGVPPDKLAVIYNGLDLAHFHPGLAAQHRARLRAELGVELDAPVLLYVGSGFARKGVMELLNAFCQAPPNAQLWVVGADKHAQRAQRRATALGLDARVRFFGGQKEVRPFYGAADAFALPTLYDPLPNAALEALACGLPIITTTSCGAAELVRDHENGFVVAPRDAQALAQAVRALCAPGVAAGMREAARASVLHLSSAAMAEQLVALYTRLMPASSAPPTPHTPLPR